MILELKSFVDSVLSPIDVVYAYVWLALCMICLHGRIFMYCLLFITYFRVSPEFSAASHKKCMNQYLQNLTETNLSILKTIQVRK